MKKYTDEAYIQDLISNLENNIRNSIWADISGLSTTRRNLIKKDSLIAYSFTGASDSAVRLNDYRWDLNSSTSYAGIEINGSLFEVNKTYTLSYRFRRHSGTLEAMGGHNQGCTISSIKLDEVSIDVGNDSAGSIIPVTNDNAEHFLEITLKVTNTNTFTHVYIQPNRGTATYIGVQVWDIKLEEGEGATYWVPAPEDMTTVDTIASLESRIEALEAKVVS